MRRHKSNRRFNPRGRLESYIHNATQERSKKVVFISECLLNQNIRAYGVKNTIGQGAVSDIVNELIRNGIGLSPVSCPEVEYEGLKRTACGKSHYNNQEYREICARIAEKVIIRYMMYRGDNYKVGGFICVNGSPSCAIDSCALGAGKGWSKEPGVFIEEFQKRLRKSNLTLDFIGAEMYNMNRTMDKIRSMVYRMQDRR